MLCGQHKLLDILQERSEHEVNYKLWHCNPYCKRIVVLQRKKWIYYFPTAKATITITLKEYSLIIYNFHLFVLAKPISANGK